MNAPLIVKWRYWTNNSSSSAKASTYRTGKVITKKSRPEGRLNLFFFRREFREENELEIIKSAPPAAPNVARVNSLFEDLFQQIILRLGRRSRVIDFEQVFDLRDKVFPTFGPEAFFLNLSPKRFNRLFGVGDFSREEPRPGEERIGIIDALLQEVVCPVELLVEGSQLGGGRFQSLRLDVESSTIFLGSFRPREPVFPNPFGKTFEHTFFHQREFSTDGIASAIRTHERSVVQVRPERKAAAALSADDQPGKRIHRSGAERDGRQTTRLGKLLRHVEDGLINDSRVKTVHQNDIFGRRFIVFDYDGFIDDFLFRPIDAVPNLSDVDGI